MTHLDLETIKNLVDDGIARHGLRGFARKLELDVGTLRSLKDGRDLQSSKLLAIVKGLGLQVSLTQVKSQVPAPQAGFGEGEKSTGTGEALRRGYLPIPYHASERQYGGAAPVAFSREWLIEAGLQPDTLFCVSATGAEMAPRIAQGALCLVDGGVRRVEEHAIWAFREDGKTCIRYLSQPTPGTLIISTAQQSDAPRAIAGNDLDQIQILGRVVWSGGIME